MISMVTTEETDAYYKENKLLSILIIKTLNRNDTDKERTSIF